MAELETTNREYATSEAQILSECRNLCLKLILFPEKFTFLEMIRLKEIMRTRGYQVD